MRVSFDLPTDAAAELVSLGDINQAAKEAFVIRAFETGKVSVGVVAKLLGLESRWDAERWLKERDVEAPISHEQLDQDRAALDEVLGPPRR